MSNNVPDNAITMPNCFVLMQEMQQTMGILNPKQSLPELSEVFTKLFGGASGQAQANKRVGSKLNKPIKKRS